MITAIKGRKIKVNRKDKEASIEVETDAGVTYEINTPLRIINQITNLSGIGDKTSGKTGKVSKKGQYSGKSTDSRVSGRQFEIRIHTSHQVREDSQTLYGFMTREERDFFEILLGVSGIGPKIALAILNTYTIAQLKGLIEKADYSALTKVSGLGKKGAQKIIVDLEGKVADLGVGDLDFADGTNDSTGILAEVEGALEGLGFRGRELEGMLNRARDILRDDPGLGAEGLIGLVLKG